MGSSSISQGVYCVLLYYLSLKVKHRIYFQSASVNHHANFWMLLLIDLQLLVTAVTKLHVSPFWLSYI
jgi:hypothetical protein